MNPAKLTDRFLAYLIDTAPFVAGCYASLFWLTQSWQRLPDTPRVWRTGLAVWAALYVLYHGIANALGGGVGKKLLGIRVVDQSGQPLAAGRAFLRAFGLFLSTPLCNLGFLWAFVDSESRAWHDLLAGSRVIEDRPKAPGEALANALWSFAALAALAGASWWLTFARPTPQDLAAIEKARTGLRVLAQIEDRYKARHGAYTDQLTDLAEASGDFEQFKTAMRELFDARRFRIQASRDRYFLSARAQDRRHTVVSISGP